MRIDIIADIVCPWCFIGIRRLSAALANRRKATVDIRWRPFLLAPDIGPEGIGQSLFLARAFGTESRAGQFQASVETAGAAVGIDFRFDIADFTPNALPAHRLIRAFDGGLDTLRLVDSLYSAYFCDGVDIGDPSRLTDIALAQGLEPARVTAAVEDDSPGEAVAIDEADTSRLGINGVPSFIFAERNIISGAHDDTVLSHMIDVSARLDPGAA